MSKKTTSIGGQAVLEGVMMRGKKSMATAVRTENGEILLETVRLTPPEKQNKILKVPVIRGAVQFFNSLVGGTKTLLRSASVFGEDEPSNFEKWLETKLKIKATDIAVFLGAFLGILLSVFLFFFVPQFIADLIPFIKTGSIWYFLIEGLIRILIFIGYILLTSLMKDIKRTYMYHGAEHKTISCYEKGLELTPENVKTCSRVHDRCGTTFMFIVMTISILVFAVLNLLLQKIGIPMTGGIGKLYRFIFKLISLPIVAGISYEILKFLAKQKSKFFIIFKAPGLLLQRITTLEPDLQMIEVAITAFNKVLEMDEDESIEPVKFNVVGNVKSVLNKAKVKLSKAGIDECEAEWIVSLVLSLKRSELNVSKANVVITDSEKIDKIVEERLTGKPLWYIFGNTDFYGHNFIVNESVLIPRPETEELVDLIIKENESGKVLDLCTGSGSIAVSLSLTKKFQVTASDISSEALKVATKNNEILGGEVDFILSNMFNEIVGEFDIIVSNPPYIKTSDLNSLQKEVKFEPTLALDGGEDGLEFYRIIAKNAIKYLKKCGKIYLEVGIDQANLVKTLFINENPNYIVEIIKDLQGVERIVKVVKND